MSTMFFTDAEVTDWASASTSDTAKYAAFFRGMLERGFTIAPSQFEACFVSLAHTEADIDAFISAAREVLDAL
jgi:glutamate-1-semialdehyde 2,1-aminomutase